MAHFSKTIRTKINNGTAQYEFLERSIQQLADDKSKIQRRLKSLAKAQVIIQTISVEIQQSAHREIANVVSLCLSSVFDRPYTFKIQFERKRGKTEATLLFERNGLLVDPMTASGGGVVDVAAFALRLACLLLSKPKKRRLVILDEPFKFVSEKYHDRLRFLLEELSEKFKIQFIIVTHIKKLIVGNVIEL